MFRKMKFLMALMAALTMCICSAPSRADGASGSVTIDELVSHYNMGVPTGTTTVKFHWNATATQPLWWGKGGIDLTIHYYAHMADADAHTNEVSSTTQFDFWQGAGYSLPVNTPVQYSEMPEIDWRSQVHYPSGAYYARAEYTCYLKLNHPTSPTQTIWYLKYAWDPSYSGP